MDAPFVVAGVALDPLLLGIRNSWDSITYVIAAGAEEGSRTERPLKPPPA